MHGLFNKTSNGAIGIIDTAATFVVESQKKFNEQLRRLLTDRKFRNYH